MLASGDWVSEGTGSGLRMKAISDWLVLTDLDTSNM